MFIGYIETFMYRYLFDLGASQLLIGLTVTVGAPFELVFTLVAASVVAKVGHAHVIMLGLLAYSVRLLGMLNSCFLRYSRVVNVVYIVCFLIFITVLLPIY